MYGVIDFYKEAVANGIKPILGCEVYTAARTRFDKQPGVDADQGHLVLLAKDNEGYKNLMKIVSIGFTEGLYYKPRIDMEVLEKHSKGIIALSACLSGDVPKAILQNNYQKAKEIALKYDQIFGRGNFYLELQKNGIDEQNLVNQKLVQLSRETGIPLVATNDAHYLTREDARVHEILLCIQTGKSINDENRMTFSTDEVYVKSPDEMYEAFKNIPEALENTVKIAESCNVTLEFHKLHLPEYKVPGNQDPYTYLRDLCFKGLLERYGSDVSKDKTDRLEYELSVIKQMGYVDYFLIVWDFIKFAKDNGIMVGPGRGSGAGSLVAYCLKITNIDPLKYNLIFERFLNPERVSMPDLDIDFCYERRQEVIDYVVKKYGRDKVAQIITFGTMAARAAIRDVGRALDIPYNEVDQVAKMVPMQLGITIEKAMELNPELRKRCEDDAVIGELIEMAKKLEGMPRHSSIHAAGVVISKDPITEYVPLQGSGDNITTQFGMTLLEELGLLKMDFLALRTLTIIRDTVELIKKDTGRIIDIDSLDMDDPNVYRMISEGKTAGVFQLESAGMTQFMKELQPASLEDIIAGISLYRPGPMDQIPRYIRNKNNPEDIKYDHPLLENILNVTYGCMIYQEQVMQIVRDLAGYSMGRSDLVRRAMAKKKVDVMQKERQNFIYGITDDNGNVIVKGAVRNGVDEKIANKIFDEMMDFASYAFNKSHAAAYAVVAYQTAWLRYYYPTEFFAAMLNTFLGSSEKVARYVNECKLLNIEVLPPDINESDVKFTVVNGKIRFGLTAVKNVGEGAVRSIIDERTKNGKFKGLRDFCERVEGKDVNKRCVESLIKCGAFDSFGIYRSRLMASYEKLLDMVHEYRKKNVEGQLTIFEVSNGIKEENFVQEEYPDINEYPSKMLLAMEKEMLGLYVSGHPLTEYQEEINSQVTLFSTDINTEPSDVDEEQTVNDDRNLIDGQIVTVAGIITEKKIKTTKNNNLMAFITLEDLYGSMEIIVFPTVLEKYSSLINEENIVVIKGRISIKEGENPKIICDQVKPMHKGMEDTDTVNNQPVRAALVSDLKHKTGKLYIKLKNSNDEALVRSLHAMLKFFNGTTPVCIYYEEEKRKEWVPQDCWLNINDYIISELRERFGEENVKYR